jgi:hypothetical protein
MLACHRSVRLLMLSIRQDLLSPQSFLLECVGLVLILGLRLHKLLLLDLLRSLEHYLVFLLLVKALEVVRLDTVWSQHRNFSLRVFCHHIMIVDIVYLSPVLVSPMLMHLSLSGPLFLSHELVNPLSILLILVPSPIVLRLSFSQNLEMVQRLLVKQVIDIRLSFPLQVFLFDLLLTPVLLL